MMTQSGTAEKRGFYITTAIAYPNSRMHVGFGWEVIGADMVARFYRMTGRPVFFCTGVDEHSQNVEKAAVKEGQTPKAYCDRMAEDIRKVMAQMDIAYDRFIRTSDPDHERVCRYLIQKAFESKDVYKHQHEGLYCDSCEVFYTEKEAVSAAGDAPTAGTYSCPVHKTPLRILAEENYFFRLSKYEPQLKSLFRNNPGFLEPEGRRNEILSFLEQGLKDFSVSRTTFKWGIPLPFDRDHIIYVWYDALINYLSAVRYPVPGAESDPEGLFETFWPCDVHVIGKDITRFHTIYWPAMLWSAGIELPRAVWAHGFISFQGEKMSKSRGNIVTPDEVIADFGVTALRWYLLSANGFGGDGNYSDQDLVLKCNADLSNNIGNLVNRVVSMSRKYFPGRDLKDHGTLPAGITGVEARLVQHLGPRGEKLEQAIGAMDLSGYCARLIEFSMSLNKFIDETKPWSLAKGTDDAAARQLESVLAQLLEGIRNLGIGLWPVIPQAAEGILAQIGLEHSGHHDGLEEWETDWDAQKLHSARVIKIPKFDQFGFDSGREHELADPKPLFPRLEQKA